MESILIPQYYQRYNTFDDLSKNKPTEMNVFGSARQLEAKDVLEFDQLFIIAEPGYGKTTLLTQVVELLEKEQLSFYYENGIRNDLEKNEMPKDRAYFIFDALDENKDIVATFLRVFYHCREHGIKLIITNRTHYLPLIQHLLMEANFSFIRLLEFEDFQISAFMELRLKTLDFSREDIEKIVQNSKADSRKSILSVPRYLSEFCKYILHHKKQPSEISDLRKSELFERVIYYKLEYEDKAEKSNSNQKYLTKRVLERLSLVMEIHGLNQISKEDFITLLDLTDSNISLIFLNSIDLDVLLERVMKTTGDMLQFENSEFQEYLAAKELTRLGYRFQTIYDLMIDPELQILRQNWIDVLSFAVDMEPEFARPIITFIQTRRHEGIDEKLIAILMNIPPNLFDIHFQDLFFQTVFDYYAAKGKMFYQIYDQLSKFISRDNTAILLPLYAENDLTDPVRHIQANQILLIEALAKAGRLNDGEVELWVGYLIRLVQKDELYSIHTTIFYALIALNRPEPLLKLIHKFENKEDYLLNNLLHALTKMAPDEPRLIALIKRIILLGRNINNLDSAINNITSAKNIIAVFDTLGRVSDGLRNDTFQYGHGFYRLFESIEALNNNKVDRAVQKFVLASYAQDRYAHYLPKICEQSLIYLIKKDRMVLKKIMQLKTFLSSVDELVRSLAIHIDVPTFQLIEVFLIKNNAAWRLERVVRMAQNQLERVNDHPLYIYLDKKYIQVWSKTKKQYVGKKEKTSLEQLRDYYLEDKKFFNPALIPFLVNKFDELEAQLSSDDRTELIEVIAMILESYKPDVFKIEIQQVKENQTSFSHNQDTWFHIELYFKAAYLLGEKKLIITYREKLLKTLPRIDIFEHQRKNMLQNLVKTISPISAKDVKLLYDFCMSRTDDMLALSARSLAEVAKTFKLDALNPVLFKLVQDPKVKSWEKEETLAALGELARDKQDFANLKLFFDAPSSSLKLKDIANAAMITRFKDRDSILWRFKELRERLREFDTDHKYNGARGVSSFESEMDRPEFPVCFYGIEDPLIYAQMLELLTYSFSLRNKKLHFRYSVYLQQIIYSYFKTFITAQVISDLRKVAAKFPVTEQTFSFSLQLDELIKDLHQKKKNPEPFISAIQGLNHILSKVYLPVNSHSELRELILKVINTEIKNLIENEGFYRVSDQLKSSSAVSEPKLGEVLIQKTLKIALEKALMENGLRKSDIYREVESYDGLKYDYLISYGLYGPIMVELKLLQNPEIQNEKQRRGYRIKMTKYLNANYRQGIYLIFQTHDNPKQLLAYEKLLTEYRDLPALDIPLLKCYQELESSAQPVKR
ncbi:hypothetical protein [Pedobacter jeongneungensis]